MNRLCPNRWYSNGLALLFIVLSAGLWCTTVCAQTLRIKLVNGRDGHPIADSCVNVWVGDRRKQAMAIPTDKDGIARLRLTENDGEIDVDNRWKACGDFGVIRPVVKYDDSFQVNVGYVLCQPHSPNNSWLSSQPFSTQLVLRSGVITGNVCGNAEASPEPGELVMFVRPLTFCERLKQ
jgi:hypothetical protein